MHLTKRNSTYYVRLHVPFDLQKYFPYPEIKRSLGTGSYKQAKGLAVVMAGRLQEVFTMARSGVLSDEQIQRMAKEHIDTKVSIIDRKHPMSAKAPTSYHQSVAGRFDTEEEYDAYLQQLQDKLTSWQKMKARYKAHEVDEVRFIAQRMLDKEKIDEAKVSATDYQKLCAEVLNAEIQYVSVLRERVQGNTDTAYDREVIAKPKSDKLSDVIKAFLDTKGKVRSRAQGKYHDTVGKILECLEEETGKRDILLSDIDYALTKRLSDLLAKYPLYRHTRHKGQTLKQACKAANAELPSAQTLEGMLYTLGSLYTLGLSKFEGLRKNYMEGMGAAIVPDEKKKSNEYRDIYRTPDLESILSELKRRKDKGEFNGNMHLLLIPLIAMYQGFRINEICQLQIDDILQVDGLWCFSINEDGAGKSVKNTNSRRINPMHPMLEQLGLVKFWESQKKQGCVRLWEGETMHSCAFYEHAGNHSHYMSKWFNNTFKKKVTLSNAEKQSFHSFRHTFVNWYRQNLSMVEHGEAVAALSGHLDKDDVSVLQSQGWNIGNEGVVTYAKDLNVNRQYETLKLLDYQLDLSGLAI